MQPDERILTTRAWVGFIALLLFAFLARGLTLACILPPLEMWDEYQHVAYVAHLAAGGQTPFYGTTRVPESIVRAAVGFPQSPSGFEQLQSYGGRTYDQFWNQWPQRSRYTPAGAVPLLYEAQHPPMYYRLAAVLWGATRGETNLSESVALLRLANVVIGALALAIILSLLARLCRDRRHAMLLGLWVTFQPLLLLNMDRVANDGLAFLLGTAVVASFLLLLGRPVGSIILYAIGVGVLLGLAVIIKATNLALVPFAAGCMLLAVGVRRWSARQAAVATLCTAAVGAAIAAPMFWFNWHHYHMLVPLQQAFVNRSRRLGWMVQFQYLRVHKSDVFPWLSRWLITDGLWLGGWSFLRPPSLFAHAYAVLLAVAALGYPLGRIFRRESSSSLLLSGRAVLPAMVLLNFCFYAGLIVHGVEAALAWGYDGTWPWYAQVATPWLLVLIAISSIGYRNSRLRYTFTMAVPTLFVLTEWFCTWRILAPHAAQMSPGRLMLSRLAALQPSFLHTPTLLVAAAGSAVSTAAAFGWCAWMLWPNDWQHWPEDHSANT